MAVLNLKSAVLALSLLTSQAQAQLYNKTIQTEYGPVQGFKYFNESTLETFFNRSTSNVAAFLGIPFAADTGYQNRWKAPQRRESWNTTFLATEFGPPCPTGGLDYISEDCLSVNIWTNANSSSDKLPVIVWNQGSDETSNNTWWYGGGMAMKDVITVTFNRRDDAFGFLAHPELNAESLALNGHNSSGNYGILDHLEVLKWVQRNIVNFGGDPDRVTIAGQSFGSSQVYHAINSELFNGTFVGAISESGIRWPYDTLLAGLATSYVEMDTALNFGINYTEFHNVSTIAEMRNLSMESLVIGSQDRNYNYSYITSISTAYPLIFKPVLDYYIIPKTYLQTLIDGPPNDVPTITGNAKDESGAALSTNFTIDEYISDCTAKYGNLSSKYFDLYPAANNASTADRSWNAAARDTSLIGDYLFANAWAESASSPFYTYYWTHAPPGQSQGAFHQSEIMYVLNALYANDQTYPFTAEDFYIQELMSAYWANFAKTGNPNEGGSFEGEGTLPYWGPNNGSATVMELGDAFAPTLVAGEGEVSLIEAYFAQQSPY